MCKEPSRLEKYRYIKIFGRISRENNKYTFVAFTWMECPVQSMSNRSQWTLVNEIYDLIIKHQ